MLEKCGTCQIEIVYEDEEDMPFRDADNQAVCDTCYAVFDSVDHLRSDIGDVASRLAEHVKNMPASLSREDWYAVHERLCFLAGRLLDTAGYARMQAEA